MESYDVMKKLEQLARLYELRLSYGELLGEVQDTFDSHKQAKSIEQTLRLINQRMMNGEYITDKDLAFFVKYSAEYPKVLDQLLDPTQYLDSASLKLYEELEQIDEAYQILNKYRISGNLANNPYLKEFEKQRLNMYIPSLGFSVKYVGGVGNLNGKALEEYNQKLKELIQSFQEDLRGQKDLIKEMNPDEYERIEKAKTHAKDVAAIFEEARQQRLNNKDGLSEEEIIAGLRETIQGLDKEMLDSLDPDMLDFIKNTLGEEEIQDLIEEKPELVGLLPERTETPKELI